MLEWLRNLLDRRQGQIHVIGSQNSTSVITNAIGHLTGNIICLVNNINIFLGNNIFKPFTTSSNTDPDPGFSHATLVYSKDDEDDVKDLRLILQGLQLDNGNVVRVALEEDIVPDGVTEVGAFDQCLSKSELILLFITKNFVTSRQDVWKGNVALTESLGDGKKVIPIFTVDKKTATYLEECFCLRSVRGINYHQRRWNEDTRKAFLKNFNRIEKQRESPEQVNVHDF